MKLRAITVVGACLVAALLSRAYSPVIPTQQDYETTCLTLKYLVDKAAHQQNMPDATNLAGAYEIALKKVSDPESLRDQTTYVRRVEELIQENNQTLAGNSRGPDVTTRRTSVFTLDSAGSDDEPVSASSLTVKQIAKMDQAAGEGSTVAILSKGQLSHLMHSKMDAVALSKSLTQTGLATSVSNSSNDDDQ